MCGYIYLQAVLERFHTMFCVFLLCAVRLHHRAWLKDEKIKCLSRKLRFSLHIDSKVPTFFKF